MVVRSKHKGMIVLVPVDLEVLVDILVGADGKLLSDVELGH